MTSFTYVIFINTKKNSPLLSVICCCITSYPNVLWLKITTIDVLMIWHSDWIHTELLACRSCSLTWPQSSDSSTGMNWPNCLSWHTLLLLHWPPTLWKARQSFFTRWSQGCSPRGKRRLFLGIRGPTLWNPESIISATFY